MNNDTRKILVDIHKTLVELSESYNVDGLYHVKGVLSQSLLGMIKKASGNSIKLLDRFMMYYSYLANYDGDLSLVGVMRFRAYIDGLLLSEEFI